MASARRVSRGRIRCKQPDNIPLPSPEGHLTFEFAKQLQLHTHDDGLGQGDVFFNGSVCFLGACHDLLSFHRDLCWGYSDRELDQ